MILKKSADNNYPGSKELINFLSAILFYRYSKGTATLKANMEELINSLSAILFYRYSKGTVTLKANMEELINSLSAIYIFSSTDTQRGQQH